MWFIPSLPKIIFPACECNTEGSISSDCTDSGQCECKNNVEGVSCDYCKPGYFGFPDCQSIHTFEIVIKIT